MTYTGSQAQSGRGTQLSIGATPTLIGELNDFPLNRNKWDTADVTNFQSGSDSEYIATIRKGSTITLKGNRVSSDAGQVLVETAYQAGTPASFTGMVPKTSAETTSGDKWVFSALVLSFDFAISPTREIAFSIDLQVTSAIVYTAGS